MKRQQKIIRQMMAVQNEHTGCVHPCMGDNELSYSMVKRFVQLCRETLFPGYYGSPLHKNRNLEQYLTSHCEKIQALLATLALSAFCFECKDDSIPCCTNKPKGIRIANEFIEALPNINQLLLTDVNAIANIDPAARSIDEIIFSYPGLRAIISHRIAHQLLKQGIPLVPRMISELAHRNTGIDIHPAAPIGSHFAIDHGTGTVIGSTSIIGNNVTIYQGVTLGAKTFAYDDAGKPMDIPRHPIVEDDVTIYAGAKIMGRVTIGRGSVIGGNVWLTESVPPNSRVVRSS
jgi:serine O-acetyltransferase